MNLKAELQHYGVAGRSTRLFGNSAQPELLDYLDLVESRGQTGLDDLWPDGVAESQGRPLLFFVNESRLSQTPQQQQFIELRRKLACRGNRAYLARIRSGELSVVPVSLDDTMPNWKVYKRGTPEALTFFARLAHGHYDGEGEPKEADYVFSAMFKLVLSVADRLAELNLKRTDVLSLMGRALFFRFLKDRQVVREDDVARIAPNAANIRDCFVSAKNAAATSAWLDRTFNGDLLPLSDGGSAAYFEEIGRRTGGKVFFHLNAIIRGEEPSGDSGYQIALPFHWGAYDFAHIPVGLLSQVYECFAWKWEHQNSKETSVHYTPRNIAAALVDEAFEGLPKAHEAHVLDPACGAGVFLVLAFRRLYRERWEATGNRPDTKAIREILENQLVGFDISDSALKLSALSLYLTAIELDPKPVPPEKLRFKALINPKNPKQVVLHNFRCANAPKEGPIIGSLGEYVGNRFDGEFDLVLSNPPWTSLPKKEKELAEEYANVSREIIKRKGETKLAQDYQNPDCVPDLPFIWKSTEWCKPNGRIAMALPSRILFKHEGVPSRARETLFRLIEITGIINGSNLSDTEVWPDMQQPFMLLFARNRRPKAGHVVQFITPYCDTVLNRNGDMRIDSKSAQTIELETTFEEPWLWKTLAVGTSLDAEVIRRIKLAAGRPLQIYWEKDLGLVSRNGYQIKDRQEQKDASFLRNLPDLNSTHLFRFVVKPRQLQPFTRSKLFRPRERKAYQAPLTLLLLSPKFQREDGWALLSFQDVAYNESFHGYSAAGHTDSNLLARYLHLFVHSYVWMHYALLTSPKFGAERRQIYKTDLDECPIFPFHNLSDAQKKEVLALSKRIEHEDNTVFEEIDVFFASLYGLDKLDLGVIRDTLAISMPYDESRESACRMPTAAQRETFRRRLESVLRPFFKVLGKEPHVVVGKPSNTFLQTKSPFGILLVGERGRAMAEPDELLHETVLQLADDTGTTRIIQQINSGLRVGILSQYRYWTPSRARLLGAEIVRRHMSIFEE